MSDLGNIEDDFGFVDPDMVSTPWQCDYCLCWTLEPFFNEGDITECPDCYDRLEAKEQYEMADHVLDFCLCDSCLYWWKLP
jgi:hypothetical protein